MTAVLSLSFGIASAEDPPVTSQNKPETKTQPEPPSSPKEEISGKKLPSSDTTKASAEPDCE
jgi:hypothetical protein